MSLSNYDIIKPIGKGKFSIVFKARSKDSNEFFALKRIKLDDKNRVKVFKEVKIIQSLKHGNIVELYSHFLTDSELILVMEYAGAGDLKRQLRRTREKNARFDERVIWKYFCQISRALSFMHGRRIMHRDLKPANIFLTVEGVVKVGDLGLGRLFSDQTMEAFSKVGTPLYMSPEVLKGNGYDFSSDVWSLGCILYELIALRSPFKEEGLKLVELFQKISKGKYKMLPTVYSEDLRSLVNQMLNQDVSKRPLAKDIYMKAERMCEKLNLPRQKPVVQKEVKPTESVDPFVRWSRVIDRLCIINRILKDDNRMLEFCSVSPICFLGRKFDTMGYFRRLFLLFCDILVIECSMIPSDEQSNKQFCYNAIVVLEHFGHLPNYITATSLENGKVTVCATALEILCEQFLFSRKFSFETPVHSQEVYDLEYDDLNENDESDQTEESLSLLSHTSLQIGRMIIPCVTRELWLNELNDVMPSLKVVCSGQVDWVAHMSILKSSKKFFINDKQLECICSNLTAELLRISQMECRCFSGSNFAVICSTYKDLQEVLDSRKSHVRRLQDVIAKTSQKLSVGDDRLNELTDSIRSETHSFSNHSPLVAIRSTIGQLKKDIASMNMRIGIIEALLIANRSNPIY